MVVVDTMDKGKRARDPQAGLERERLWQKTKNFVLYSHYLMQLTHQVGE
jgi:hypothetical protein